MPDLPLQGCLPGVLHLTTYAPPSHHSVQHDPCLLLGFRLVRMVAQLLQTPHTDQGGEKLQLRLGWQSLTEHYDEAGGDMNSKYGMQLHRHCCCCLVSGHRWSKESPKFLKHKV